MIGNHGEMDTRVPSGGAPDRVRIGPALWVFAFLYSVFIVIFTDYLAYTIIGALVSVGAAMVVLLVSLFRYRYGVLALLFILFTFPSFPRDLIDINALLLETRVTSYYSIKFLSFAGFSLAQWLFVSLFVISFIRFLMRGGRIRSILVDRHLKALLLLLAILIIGSFHSSMLGREVLAKEFVSDLRFPVLFLFGIFIAWSYVDDVGSAETAIRKLAVLLMVLVIISGFKTVFFIADDRLQGIFRLSLANPVYVLFPFLLALAVSWRHLGMTRAAVFPVVLLGALAIIPEGRGAIILYGLTMILAAIVVFRWDPESAGSFVRQMLVLSFVFMAALLVIVYSNERLWGFLKYKASFFTQELLTGEFTSSPSVRIYEFRNILSENGDTTLGHLMGKGAGGYFKHRDFPLPFEPGVSDYTLKERSMSRYYRPHLPVNYWLLKGGIAGLLLYGYFFLRMYSGGRSMFAMSMFELNSSIKLFSLFLVFSAIPGFFVSFWQPDYIMFYSIALVLAYLMLTVGEQDTVKTARLQPR